MTMKNPTAYGFALLLLVQAMSAALYVVPNEEKLEERQTPVFESSARSNNSSSPCGSNVNYTYTYAYAPYMVMENQSFTTSSYVYCEIPNAMMMLDYSIVDSNNSTVHSGNQSWTGSNASSSNYTWNVSGLSAGYYTFNADLYVDGTYVDTDYDSFMVYANTSGGGGNNSGGGGNQTSPCGSNASYASVYAYAPYMVMENQSFTTSTYVNCEVLNATMVLEYSIINSNNNTVHSGNQSWIGTSTTSSNYTWNVSGLSAGYYTFNAELYVDGTSVDSDDDSFMVYANTSGGGGSGGGGNYTSPCGSNVNYTYTYAYAPYMVMENQSFTTSSYVYCEIPNAMMMLDYSIVDSNNSTVHSGNQSWTGSNASSSNYTWNVSGLSAGYYTFNADLYVDGTYVDTDYDSFMVYANTSGGGGNNSGGGGNQTSPCGSNASYASVYAYAPYMVMENQSFTTSTYVNCEVLNATMVLEYSIINSNNNTVHSGNQSWIGTSTTSSNYTWNVSGLSAGYYTFNAELYVDGTSVDSDDDSFMVYDNNSDTDGDGVLDSLDAFPMDANETSDYDGDGVGDNEDTDDDNDGVSDSADAFPTDSSETEDIDGDGVGNNADTDDDNDGVDDNLDEFPLDSSEAFDNDGDGVGDNADMDDDNDGVSDQEDAFPFDGGASNDSDADGVADAYDNCITVFNPGQTDADLDGIGTECDADESTGNSGNNTGGETGGNNTGGETGGNTTDTSNWTECEVWEYFNQELIEETEPGNGCPFYEDTSEEDGAEEDTEGLPSVGFFATLTIVGLAIAFARQEKE